MTIEHVSPSARSLPTVHTSRTGERVRARARLRVRIQGHALRRPRARHALEVREIDLLGHGSGVVEKNADLAVRAEGKRGIDAVADGVGEALLGGQGVEFVVERLGVTLEAQVLVAIVVPPESGRTADGDGGGRPRVAALRL